GLILDYMKNAEKHMGGKNIQIRALGNIGALNSELQSEIARVTDMTRKNTGIVLNIAWNYGSRDEIVNAIKQIAIDIESGKYTSDNIKPELVSNKLYTRDIPDPDIMIRPGGEYRISNFLLWQSAYTEFWYTDVLWPDFRNEHIIEAISEFQRRNRRFGGV
ncbi:MAG: di-trans,poly-cis-decaprenylcistransferase, partial [Clostridiaceae bacterium]|nr:di-trans,poly-cis-decaprenylcistransferase [Clostridiaceae bacterium]